MKKLIYKLAGVAFLLPAVTLAAEGKAQFEIVFMPASAELYIELFNLVIGIAMAFVAIKVAALVQGGKMEKVWNLMALAAGIFAIFEIVGGLEKLNILHMSGLTEVLEAAFIVAFLVAFSFAKKSLKESLFGKTEKK